MKKWVKGKWKKVPHLFIYNNAMVKAEVQLQKLVKLNLKYKMHIKFTIVSKNFKKNQRIFKLIKSLKGPRILSLKFIEQFFWKALTQVVTRVNTISQDLMCLPFAICLPSCVVLCILSSAMSDKWSCSLKIHGSWPHVLMEHNNSCDACGLATGKNQNWERSLSL